MKSRSVLWRSVHGDGVGYVFAARLLADDPDSVALFQPVGAAVARRAGPSGGPRGAHEHRRWEGSANVRLHVRGTAVSVIRRWDGTGFAGWYLNLELPWWPSPFGYDSRDLVLERRGRSRSTPTGRAGRRTRRRRFRHRSRPGP